MTASSYKLFRKAQRTLEWVPLTHTHSIFNSSYTFLGYMSGNKAYYVDHIAIGIFDSIASSEDPQDTLQRFPEYTHAYSLYKKHGANKAFEFMQLARFVIHGFNDYPGCDSDKSRAQALKQKAARKRLLIKSRKKYLARQSVVM